jgi:hypothetical protein
MFTTIFALGIILNQQGLIGTHIYRVGPNNDLYILGFCIDTLPKYWSVAAFCFLNSGMRTLNGEVLRPWITTQVQDLSKPVEEIPQVKAYVISCIASLYGWFDFFMYMNILLTQIDMMFIEVTADITMTLILTRYYLQPPSRCSNKGDTFSAKGADCRLLPEPQQFSGDVLNALHFAQG